MLVSLSIHTISQNLPILLKLLILYLYNSSILIILGFCLLPLSNSLNLKNIGNFMFFSRLLSLMHLMNLLHFLLR
jgi:hypothetical protein